MAPNKKHGTTSGSEPEPPAREMRSRGTKRKAVENGGTEGNGDATADPEPASAPAALPSTENTATRKKRGTRAASNGPSQPSNLPAKKVSSKVSKRTAVLSATESAEEANSSSGAPAAKRRRVEKKSTTTTSSADPEDVIFKAQPSSMRQSSPRRQRADDQSNPSGPAKRQRLIKPLDDDSSIVVQHDTLDPTIVLTQNSEENLHSSSSNQPSPSPYPVYEAPSPSDESRPDWKEPKLAGSLEDQLKITAGYQYSFYAKKEYVMDKEADELYDILGEDRKLLNPPAAPRGRGRGRGRGGRGRGRGGAANSRAVVESSEAPIATVQGRGRGGYRVKKSEDPRIQALYHRRAAMRNQYRSIANFQRAALEALGEKSLEILKADPEAYSQLPGFDQASSKLGELFEKTMRQSKARLKIHGEFLVKKKEQDKEYESRLQEFAAIEDEDELLVEFFNAINHISRQIAAGASDEEVPSYPSDADFNLVQIQRPRKVVAIEGTPYGTPGDWPATVGDHVSTIGDTELEQHPANFKRSIHPDDRKKFQQNLLRQRQMSSTAKAKKKGVVPKSSLLNPNEVGSVQPAPTPGEVSEMEQRGNDSDDDSSSGAEVGPVDAVDKYSVRLPNKPTPKNGLAPNNRFVVTPHFQYDKIEIGNRTQKNKRTNTGESQYVGKDADPNPKAFHFDQRATGQYNSARNKAGDLDEDLVAVFKVHPIYGLAIPSSVNPTHEDLKSQGDDKQNVIKPRTDWSEPLAPSRPIVFIESNPYGTTESERAKNVYHTSRSVRFIRAQQLFEEQSAKSKIHRVLREIFEEYKGITLNTMFRDPTVEPSPPPLSPKGKGKEIEVQPSLMPALVEAVNEAKRLLTEKEVADARMKLLRSAVRRYDPVRDEFTTSYPEPAPPPPEDRAALNLLANLADSPRYKRQPPTYHQPYAAPPTWGAAGHQPVAMSHSHGHPQPHHQPMHPPRSQPSGSLRQLLPAPPQVQAPPKPHQYRY